MKKGICSAILVAAITLILLLPTSVGADSPDTETSIIVTDVMSGSPLVDKNFTTDLQISITNSITSTVGVMGFEAWVSFDKDVVTIQDFDGDTENGDQVEVTNGFFDGDLVVVANQVYYDPPDIPHPTECETQSCVYIAATHTGGSGAMTNQTGTVATITWIGMSTGSPAFSIPVGESGSGSILADAEGEIIPIDDTSVPSITVTHPGTIQGNVQRQGSQTGNTGAAIVAREDNGVIATTTTITGGNFSLEVPIGGDYTINASYPGYLHAQKSSVYVAGSTVDIESTTLVGGDVNADNCINILDIVSIVGKFNQTEVPASDPQDINDDGNINIFDLTIAAGNFARCGPTAW